MENVAEIVKPKPWVFHLRDKDRHAVATVVLLLTLDPLGSPEYLGIGMTIKSKKDGPNPRRGRQIAEARANLALSLKNASKGNLLLYVWRVPSLRPVEDVASYIGSELLHLGIKMSRVSNDSIATLLDGLVKFSSRWPGTLDGKVNYPSEAGDVERYARRLLMRKIP